MRPKGLDQTLLVGSPSSMHQVTRLVMTPTLLQACLLEAQFNPSLRYFTSSGELLTRTLLEKLQRSCPQKCTILNLYGSTEVAADATCAQLPMDDLAIQHPLVPCGRAIHGVRVEVCNRSDGAWTRCADGEEGEVFIFGVCLSSGRALEKETLRIEQFSCMIRRF